MSAQQRASALPTAASGMASLIAVAGSGRLRQMAHQVRTGVPLVPGLRGWSSQYARGLERGAATLRRRS